MKKRIIASLLLLCTLSSFWSYAEPLQPPISSAERIKQIVQELETIQVEKEKYLNELENIQTERATELTQRETDLQQRENLINERMTELTQKEADLNETKIRLELFGNLIDDQAIYCNNLKKQVTAWQTISGILAGGLITLIAVQAGNK